LKISASDLANLSDFPVSVANKIVHLTRLAKALPINFAENFTALFKKKLIVRLEKKDYLNTKCVYLAISLK